MEALVLEGLAPSQAKAVLKSRGLGYSDEVMDRIAGRIAERLR